MIDLGTENENGGQIRESTRIAALATTDSALVTAEAKRIEVDVQRKANEIGKEVLKILDRGPDLSPADAGRLLKLWVLRCILLRDEQVTQLGRCLKEIRDLLATAPAEDHKDIAVSI